MSSPLNSRCARNPRRTERGSAVITVLVLAAVTAVIAAGFLARSVQESRLATRSFYQSVVLNLAEAGLEEALHAANTLSFNAAHGWSLASGSTTDYVKTITNGLNFPQGTGAIYIRVDQALGSTPTVTSAGVVSLPNQPRITKQLRASGTIRRIWGNGIIGRNNIVFDGSASIDSYDSTAGPYSSSTNRSDKATVATLATVTLSGSASIYGYVATAGSAPSVGSSGRIYGATSPATPLIDPTRVRRDFSTNLSDAVVPAGTAYSLGTDWPNSSNLPFTLPRVGDLPGPNGRYLYTMGNLVVGGSSSLTITGPVDLIATGNATIDGSGYVAVGNALSPNASLNLYSPGTITIGGSGMVNNTSAPANTAIWGTKPSGGAAQAIHVTGSGAYKGTIYAANGNITVDGSGGIFGALIGNSLTFLGSAVVHYDVNLGLHAPAGGPNPGTSNGVRLASWSELRDAPTSSAPFARDTRPPFTGLF